MMAVVMEVKDGYAAVLTEDGKFVKVADAGYEPGMKLSLEKKVKRRRRFGKILELTGRQIKTFGAAAAAAVCIMIGVNVYYTPYAVVSLDVNPSIEMTVNRFSRVLDVEALNDDGTELVNALVSSGIKNKNYDTAVDMALEWINEGSYEAEDGKVYVVMSASAENESYSAKVAEDLKDRSASYENIQAEVIIPTAEDVKEAQELGTTAGKMHLIKKLEEKEPDIEKKEWLERPVKDIVCEINKEPDNQPDKEPDNEPDNEPDVKQDRELNQETGREPDKEVKPESDKEVMNEPDPEAEKDAAPEADKKPDQEKPDSPENIEKKDISEPEPAGTESAVKEPSEKKEPENSDEQKKEFSDNDGGEVKGTEPQNPENVPESEEEYRTIPPREKPDSEDMGNVPDEKPDAGSPPELQPDR